MSEDMSETVVDATEAPKVEEEEVEYNCPPEFDENEELCKLFVGGIDKEITDEEFKALFEKFGEIKDSSVVRKDTKNGLVFGFATFAKCDDLDECLLARPHKYKERALDVKRAIPKGQYESGPLKVKKLHLGNIPPTFDQDAFLKFLKSRHPKKYGIIEEIDILKEKDEAGNLTEKNRGFGFITVSNEDFADRISIAEKNFTYEGNQMRINKAKPKATDGSFRGGFRGKGGQQGGNWSEGGWGYGGYGGYGYGYGDGYGYGGYDYGYGYPGYGYGPPAQGGGYGRRFAPY